MLFAKLPTASSRGMAAIGDPAKGRVGALLLVLAIFFYSSIYKSTSAATFEEVSCISQGSRPFCAFSAAIVDQCAALPSNSIFAQCNIFGLSFGHATTKQDDTGNSYASVLFKYSERNNCLTGTNESFAPFGKCDTFAAYVQILRQLQTGKCYALVNSALLGIQREGEVSRNNPNKVVQKLEVPGAYRRIAFTPVVTDPLLVQASSVLVRSANPHRSYLRSGPSISALSLLRIESRLTTKRENLLPNAAKIRLTRGFGTNSDFLDFHLSRGEQNALYDLLLKCQ
jgi:hypothetical protein